jgi:hypothetical protein
MPNITTFARSFSGGEVTPEFWGNIADNKYQTGLARCRNFVVKPHGPVENRAGFAFVRNAKSRTNRSRLLPFTFAQDQTLVIEMSGAGTFRFFTQGAAILLNGAPYEVNHPYQNDELFSIHTTQSGDILTLVHPNHPPRELRRLGPTNWQLVTIAFVSALVPPAGVFATATPAVSNPGPPLLQAYVVTAVANNGLDESPASAGGGLVAITNITQDDPGVFTLGPDAQTWAVNDTVFVSGVGGMNEVNNNSYQINTITTFGSPVVTSVQITVKVNSTPLDTTSFAAYLGGGTVGREGAARCLNNLFDTGAYNTIVWNAVPGAERYNIYKQNNGLFGYIGSSTNLSFTDDNIAPDLSKTPPLAVNPFVGDGNYPGAVGYFEQRRWFGGTINAPGNVWATRSGTETSLNYSLPIRADDSISFRVAARERNTIRHILPLDNLMLLADATEWRVAGATGGALAADEALSIRPQSFIGSAQAQPVLVNSNLIFAAARGGHIRELAYSDDRNGYITGDLSLRAPHLFDTFEIVDMAYAKAPLPIVWAVSSSGKLLGLTYVPEENIGAWHWHDTAKQGRFESVAVVAEGNEDVLYAVTSRIIDDQGDTPVRFIERMATRQQTTPEQAFFVDAGVMQTFEEPVTQVSGLGWLDGEIVSVLADGAPLIPKRVMVGTIDLEVPARTVVVGLPIEAEMQSLPLAYEAEGYGQSRVKSVNEAFVRVFRSGHFLIGPSFDRLVDNKARTTEPMGEPIRLRDEVISVVVPPAWQANGQVCIRISEPLPLTVVSIALNVAVGG